MLMHEPSRGGIPAGPHQLLRTPRRKFAAAAGTTIVLGLSVLGFAGRAGANPSSNAASKLVPIATVANGAPDHIETWAIDDGCSGGAGAGAGLVRRWVTIAESNCGPLAHKAVDDCQTKQETYCAVVQYLDTDWIYRDAQLPLPHPTPSNWWLHTPATGKARIFGNQEGGGYLLNQTVPAVRAWFRDYLRRHFNADTGLVMDDQSPSLSEELYYSTCHCQRTQEIASSTVLRAAHNAMSDALTHRDGSHFLQVDNTLAPNPFLPQGIDMLNGSVGVEGLIAEGEPEQFGGVMDPYFSTLLDQIAYVETRTSAIVIPMSHGYAGASTQSRSRRVQEGTVLLTFEPQRIVDWADLEASSNKLAVWPEEGIYPSGPLQSMQTPTGHGCLAGTGVVCPHGGHNDLQVAPGVYRREFARCAQRSVPFGGCATIVNSTAAPVTVQQRWLRQRYGHEIKLVGGDLQSAGRVLLSGLKFQPGRSTVPPHDALLLSR